MKGDPTDPQNVATALNTVLGHDRLREKLAANAQVRCFKEFLIYSQLESWLSVFKQLTWKETSVKQQNEKAVVAEERGQPSQPQSKEPITTV